MVSRGYRRIVGVIVINLALERHPVAIALYYVLFVLQGLGINHICYRAAGTTIAIPTFSLSFWIVFSDALSRFSSGTSQ